MALATRYVALALGLVVLVGTGGSVLYTLVLPRGYQSRLAVLVERRLVRGVFLSVADRLRTYEAQDRVLALGGPVGLLSVFFVWLVALVAGYGLVLWTLLGGSFLSALREAGSSLFTLGIDASPGAVATAVDFLAAGTGLLMVALEIAYLPTLYSAFNRRETLVTLLESRAGEPAWGPELLARHQLIASLDRLPALYRDWERWAADVAESHSNYPVLVAFRSPAPRRSWLVALLAVLDSAALYHAFCPESAPNEVRMCLRMGFSCLRDVAASWGIPFDPDPRPDGPLRLTYEQFLQGVERLAQSGFPLERAPEQAWRHFRGWRVNYESIAYALADELRSVPAPWSGPRRHLGTIPPVAPLDRTPEDPEARRWPPSRWAG